VVIYYRILLKIRTVQILSHCSRLRELFYTPRKYREI